MFHTGLELRLFGGSIVSWTEKKRSKVGSTVQHSAEEIYFDDVFVLWGQGNISIFSKIIFATFQLSKHI